MSGNADYILTVGGTIVLAQLVVFAAIIWWLIDAGGCI